LDERPRGLERRERARAWLYSTYTRTARAHYTGVIPGEGAEPASSALKRLETPLSDADGAVLALGAQLLLRLPRAQREVFWLYEVVQLPMLDVARTLGCTRQAAYSRLFRARERMLGELPLAAAKDATHG
jgi:DNA-directed RNA polymerase specialized sigma24 family protein